MKQTTRLIFLLICAVILISSTSCKAGESYDEPLDTSGLVLETGKDETEMRFNWSTQRQGTYSVILTQNGIDTVWDMTKTNGSVYTAIASNLLPDTEYSYVITDKNGNTSDTFTFNTGTPDSFSFLLAGDPQLSTVFLDTHRAAWDSTVQSALDKFPDSAFMVVAGDIGDTADKTEYYSFRTPSVLKSLPIAVNRGNHDAYSNVYQSQFNSPNFKDGNYWFTYGDMLVISLDSNNTDYDMHDKFIATAKASVDKKWTVVTMHHSIYSVGYHSTTEKILPLRENFSKIFSKHDIDLVLAGHDHTYSRTYFMTENGVSDNISETKRKGETLYITANSTTGSKYYPIAGANIDYAVKYYQMNTPSITNIEVDSDKITITTYKCADMSAYDIVILRK